MANYVFPQNTSPRFFEQTPQFIFLAGRTGARIPNSGRQNQGHSCTGRNWLEHAGFALGHRSIGQTFSLPPGPGGARSYWSQSLCCTSSPAALADQSAGRWHGSLQNREPAKPREWFLAATEWRLRSGKVPAQSQLNWPSRRNPSQ